jgi:beta-alanine degradation protein BauB
VGFTDLGGFSLPDEGPYVTTMWRGAVTPAQATVSVDDDRVRVTTWVFEAAAATGAHIHEFDYLVVPVTGGVFRVISEDGTEIERTQVAGVPYAVTAGTAHDVVNTTNSRLSFVEIELKR